MGNVKLGLLLMCVGMVTVFAILLIIIFSSKLIIVLINSIVKDGEPVGPAQAPSSVDAVTKAVIEAAVAKLTDGRGVVTTIKRTV